MIQVRDAPRDSTFQIGQLKYVAAVAALLLALTACGGDEQVLTWDQLENAAYPVEFVEPDGIAQLEGGEFRQQAAPGSATETVVRLAQVRSFGRIDSGSSIDAAPILTVDPGGSGTFIYLVAALNVDGHPEMAATTLLGDRVAVRSVRIVDSQIVVGMRVRGPDDPFAYLTTEITRTYVLEGSELVLLSEEASTVPPPSPGDYGFTPERIEVNEAEKETVMGRLAPGELGDYVLEGEAGQELQVALRSQFSNAILSVYGLTDGQVLVSVTEFKARFTGILPSSQDYAIRVITLAGDELDYHLDVQLQRRSSASPPLSSPTSPPLDTPTATPEVVALATPTPEVVALATPTPEVVALATPTPEVVALATPTPEVVALATPTPEVVALATPTPEVVALATPTPEVVALATPTPEVVALATPTPEVVALATPTPEVVALATPTQSPLVVFAHPRRVVCLSILLSMTAPALPSRGKCSTSLPVSMRKARSSCWESTCKQCRSSLGGLL